MRHLLLAALVLLVIGLAFYHYGLPEPWRYTRHFECSTYASRSQEICETLGRNMEFTFFGHATISPGYRVTFETTRETWCSLNIKPEDEAPLRELLQDPDWRLATGADYLLRLITGNDRYGTPEGETSIFSPENPQYLLKNGCS